MKFIDRLFLVSCYTVSSIMIIELLLFRLFGGAISDKMFKDTAYLAIAMILAQITDFSWKKLNK